MKNGFKSVALVLLAALLVFSGCAPKPEATGPEPKEKAGYEKVVMTHIEGQAINTIDPALCPGDEASLIAIVNLYDGLLFPKMFEGSMEPGPHVARDWEISPDGKTYTFYLRDDITFHDGSPLTAEDVKFSMDRILELNKGFAWLWQGIVKETEVLGEHEVAFHLEKPHAPFLSTMMLFFIVNKDEVLANKEDGEFGEFGDYGQAYLENNEAGSGPYKIREWERGAQLIFEKFEDYWQGWEPGQPDEVHFKIVREEATRKILLKSNEADIVDQWLTSESFDELERSPGVVVDKQPSMQLFHIHMHTQKPPTDNIDVRRAIAWAFDYKTACEIMGGIQAQGPVPNNAWGHNDDVFVFHQDLDKAKEEFAKSGYKPGELKITYASNVSVPRQQKIGLLLKNNLKEIGIDVEIVPETWARLMELAANKEECPHLMAVFDTLKYPHPDSHTFGLYHPSVHGSYRSASWLDVPEIAQLLEDARTTVDMNEQLEKYKKVQDLIVAQVPSIYVANPMHRLARRDHVKGYTYVGLLGFDHWFKSLRIEK